MGCGCGNKKTMKHFVVDEKGQPLDSFDTRSEAEKFRVENDIVHTARIKPKIVALT